MMRFTFISWHIAPWGGSEELWSQAALRLRREGHQVSACMPRFPNPSPKFLALGKEGIQLHTPPRYHRLGVRAWRKFNRLLGQPTAESVWVRRQKPDLVVISQPRFVADGDNLSPDADDGLSWMEICCDADIPFIALVHNNGAEFWPGDALRERLAAAYRAARTVALVSRGNLEILERQIGESLPNARLVWNPYKAPADQLPRWLAGNGNWKMACVARLDPNAKGQDLLFQVLSHPRWQERPLELNLYGDGYCGCENGLRRLAEQFHLKNVHFHGHVNDVRMIWEQNHLLVLPSRFEGLPIVLVEAMWYGRPAMVTDVGGNAEVCVDGETGFVASAPAVELLAETLERAWNRRDEWQRMGLAARARAEKLIPRDPVGDFCRQLQEIAETSHPAQASALAPVAPLLAEDHALNCGSVLEGRDR